MLTRGERGGLKCLFHPPPWHRLHNHCNGTPIYPHALSASLLSKSLLEVVTSPLLLATSTYECCIHEDSVATGEAGSQKQIGILWPDQETQEMQGFFSLPHSLLLWPEAMATAAV